MANYIAVTLFEHPDHADEGMRVLKNNGFDSSNISCVEADPESQNFFKRVFNKDGGEELEADKAMDYLTGLGIEDDEAEDYAKKVKKGHSLVIARCDSKSEAERARRLLSEEPFGQEGPTPEARGQRTTTDEPTTRTDEPTTGGELGGGEVGQPKQPGFDSPAGDVETGGERGEPLTTRTDSEEVGAGTGDVGTETSEFGADSPNISSDESEFGDRDVVVDDVSPDTATGFSNYEVDYRRHYEDYLADSDLEFDDYTRGYRYGMALADDETLADYDWETIEPEAGRQWETSETSNWDDIKEAVRYAWYKVQNREDEYEDRPLTGR